MIVDDNRDAAEMLAEILDLAGFVTTPVLNAQAALDKLAEFRPDCILIDIGLPVIDGYELARRIQALEDFKHVRLIAIAGDGQASDYKRSLDAGFSEHLVKPVDTKRLEAVLRKQLAGS